QGGAAGEAAHGGRGVQGAHQVQERKALGRFAGDGRVEVLHAGGAVQDGLIGGEGIDAQGGQAVEDRLAHHGVLAAVFGAGEQGLAQPPVALGRVAPGGGTGQRGRVHAASGQADQARGAGAQGRPVAGGEGEDEAIGIPFGQAPQGGGRVDGSAGPQDQFPGQNHLVKTAGPNGGGPLPHQRLPRRRLHRLPPLPLGSSGGGRLKSPARGEG